MLFFLWGSETFLVRQKAGEIASAFQEKYPQAYQRAFDCTADAVESLREEIETPSLFSERKLFILKDPFSSLEFQQQLLFFKEAFLKTKGYTFLVTQEGEPKKTDSFFRFLLQHAKTQEFQKLKGKELNSWIEKEFKKYNRMIAPEALQELVARTGNDLWQLSLEVQKLAAFKPSLIKKEDVAALVHKTLDPQIFATLDQATARKGRAAASLVAEHIQAGEAPLYLFSRLVNQLRLLLLARDLLERGNNARETASLLKVHPFVATKTLQTVQGFTSKELLLIYKRAFAYDVGFKTSKGDPAQLLYLFLAQIAAKKSTG
tara:strand:+ start:265 stop:1218 length:954 start_codon:yes stop_codon:yes gene_type:complete